MVVCTWLKIQKMERWWPSRSECYSLFEHKNCVHLLCMYDVNINCVYEHMYSWNIAYVCTHCITWLYLEIYPEEE